MALEYAVGIWSLVACWLPDPPLGMVNSVYSVPGLSQKSGQKPEVAWLHMLFCRGNTQIT